MAKLILEEKFRMNRTSFVICEFNPFHSGHEALLRHASKGSETLICIMSGNFTQRSECAIFDKYKRAEAAIRMGADLVLELPFPYSSAGAEFFAFGGVSVGCALGADRFVFGSESGDTEYVLSAADAMNTDRFRELSAEENDPADGAAVSFDRVMSCLGYSLTANDKLGAQYITAARRLGYNCSFEAFQRMCDPERYRSATELRRMIFENGSAAAYPYIPEQLRDVYPTEPHVIADKLAELEYNFFRLSNGNLPDTFEGEGGVLERLYRAASESAGHRELFERAATKRYTDSRLRRAALYALLGVRKADLLERPALTVLLGASEKGRAYLSSVKKTAQIKILTKPSADIGAGLIEKRQAELMRSADELYSLCLREKAAAGEYLRRKPYIE